MKRTYLFIVISFLFISLSAVPPKPLRILVITGGHDYKKEQFNQMFESFAPGMTYQVAQLPDAYDMFKPENRDKYDVLVFYHMWQKITDEQKAVFADCIKKGKPLVVLHHAMCGYDNWPEYRNIIGGKYYNSPHEVDGKMVPRGTYIHDINFNVKIADKKHPVTAGLSDFPVNDETYKGIYVDDDSKPILTTDEPSSDQVIGWVTKYGKSKITVIELGHDAPTYDNPNFRKLLRQSIEWVSK